MMESTAASDLEQIALDLQEKDLSIFEVAQYPGLLVISTAGRWEVVR